MGNIIGGIKGKLSNLGFQEQERTFYVYKKRNNTISQMLGELGTKEEELDQEQETIKRLLRNQEQKLKTLIKWIQGQSTQYQEKE